MQKLFFLLIFPSILFSSVTDATCYNYTVDEGSFYLYANGYVGGVQMTLDHDENFIINLTTDAAVSAYNTQENTTIIIIVIPESSLLFTTSDTFEIQEVIVAANMYEEVDYCPSDNLEELNQEDISDDLSITNTTPSSNDIISLYPNPFNPATTIQYFIETPTNIELRIYNISGEQVENIKQGFKSNGKYQVNWEPQLSSGQYFIQLVSGNQILSTKKAVLIK
tara:strand:- start:386 stop:1054 length:669 start_codon:yes stop_codon:yes gene_type:complete